jgi:hypothetical protein
MQKAPHRMQSGAGLCFPARRRALVAPALSLVAQSLRSLAHQSGDRGAPFGSRAGPLVYSPASTDLRIAGVLADGSDCRQTSSITSR